MSDMRQGCRACLRLRGAGPRVGGGGAGQEGRGRLRASQSHLVQASSWEGDSGGGHNQVPQEDSGKDDQNLFVDQYD